jgi:hypothetical protein
LGTPHLGSDLAKWAKVLSSLFSGILKANKEILGILVPGSETLANLQQEFWTMINARQKNDMSFPSIFCFYEELPMRGIGQASAPGQS